MSTRTTSVRESGAATSARFEARARAARWRARRPALVTALVVLVLLGLGLLAYAGPVLAVRTIEVRGRNEVAKVSVALLILRQQHKPVDAGAARFRRACDGQHGADDRLHALADARLRESHCSVKTVAVVERHCGKAELRGALRDHFRLHRAFKHREG